MSISQALNLTAAWNVGPVAAVVVTRDGVVGQTGDIDEPFALASVTKLLTAYSVLVAVEEGSLDLDDPAGPEGSTIRHLLAHASGLSPDGQTLAAVGTRRIYANAGFDVLGEHLASATGIEVAEYLRLGVLEPLGMTRTALLGSPAFAGQGTAADLGRFAAELLDPRLLAPETVALATTVTFPGLSGVLPGYGRQEANDWGLGVEIRGSKSPHWTAPDASPATFGHFGASGTFLWVDAELGAACVCLTGRDFGSWAVEAWAPFNQALLDALRAA